MKRLIVIFVLMVLVVSILGAAGQRTQDPAQWPSEPVTVITPWAVGGVADLVNRQAATFGQNLLGQPVLATNELGAGGNVALTNFLRNTANSHNLILGGEGAFAIAPNIEGSEAIRFTYADFVPIINLYSAIFIMTGNAQLGINNLDDLRAFGQGRRLKIAVNGVAGSEAFLAKALFRELGLELELVSYNGANLALDAAAKGETQFAISHQSQARGSVESGVLAPIVVFDSQGINNQVFGSVRGVGEYGFSAYFRNRAFLLARAGTDPQVINRVRNAYLEILQRPEMQALFSTLMIEFDPMEMNEFDQHVNSVTTIVTANQ